MTQSELSALHSPAPLPHEPVENVQAHLHETRLDWLDGMKAIALFWIIAVHITERIFGYPYIANPTFDWPPLAERIAQLMPLYGNGAWDIPINLIRYVGWLGDQGVQLFLIASGFGLVWSLLPRYSQASLPLLDFYRRRLWRIYPLWIGAHLVFGLFGTLVDWGASLRDLRLYLSMAGLRITPELFYYFSPAWWYVGLIIQLYMVFPVLWEGLRRLGPGRFLLISCIVAFTARAAGLFLLDSYIDQWQRGAVFVTRLPEFAMGMSLAVWMHRSPEAVDGWLRTPAVILAAVGAFAIGCGLALTLPGMIVAPLVLGAGAFIPCYAVLRQSGGALLSWAGRHSYSLFLVHHPIVLLAVPQGDSSGAWRIILGVVAVTGLTASAAIGLEKLVGTATTLFGRWHMRFGITGLVGIPGGIMALLALFALSAELAVRQIAPREPPELGWGERTALMPDPDVGWRLKPLQTTRLRWQSYDYTVVANSLGFPGPEYPVTRAPGSLRVLTVGDAYTSAEGVDTDKAWPRLLEASLRQKLGERNVEVLNFGITGYGPNQYAAVVQRYAPVYRPDLIIVELFVNDFEDVLITDDEFRRSIGFDLPAPDDWRSIVALSHLRHLLRTEVFEPLREAVRGTPRTYGYFLGQFANLERGRTDLTGDGYRRTADRLYEIRKVADQIGARLVIIIVPAPVQVCSPEQLAYYPRSIDIHDTTRFDLDQPQHMALSIAERLRVPAYDLRPVLRQEAAGCVYHPRNLHWTAAGHEVTATFLANQLARDSVIR
ncbi:acyltransferase family protein [Roseiflexus sp.]